MSAYHRLISYIYAYEGGIKGKNTGFAKLETRGTSCRIQVSVRRVFAGGSPIGVYLLAGQEEIRIGTLFVRGGNGEFRAVVNCENIEGSGCNMEECCGLTLHETDSAWRAYTTIWEDAVAHAAEVDLADVTAEKVREQEAEKEIPVTDGDQEEENLTPEGEDLPEEENNTPGEEAASEDKKEEKSKTSFFGKKKKDKSEQKVEELTDRLKRTMAEFDNFRKRTEKEKSSMYIIGAKEIVEKILPVVDNFERGLAQAQEGDAFADGMKMIYKQLTTTLDDLGVKPIEAVGKEFNPDFHNAVMHVEDEGLGENIIAEEFQKGYTYRDSVVRHSMVKVAN